MERIGWIGLGLMGSRMLPHLMEKGYQATVYDKYARLADPLVALGATTVGCPADVAAASDIVFTIVATPPDVEAVYLGPDGLFSAARPGQVFVDMTSSSTELARRLAAAGAEAGIGVLDAPVSGGPAGAELASLSIMVGGDSKVLDRVRPLLHLARHFLLAAAIVIDHGTVGDAGLDL